MLAGTGSEGMGRHVAEPEPDVRGPYPGGGYDNPWPYAQTGPAPILATVGDISCQPGRRTDRRRPTAKRAK